jgi:hypothetical protein
MRCTASWNGPWPAASSAERWKRSAILAYEKAFRKGHSYVTLVNDLERSRVLYVAEERKQSSLDGFWPTLSAEQMASIEAVAMDMWDKYVVSTQVHLPGAESKIVFDKFHVAKHLGEAVDQVRRREQKTLKAAGDDQLTGTRYDWLRSRAPMEPHDGRAFDALRQSGLKTARAWALKETAMAFTVTSTNGPRANTFAGGGTGRSAAVWSLSSAWRARSNVTSRTSSPICAIASPTRGANRSTPRFNG